MQGLFRHIHVDVLMQSLQNASRILMAKLGLPDIHHSQITESLQQNTDKLGLVLQVQLPHV